MLTCNNAKLKNSTQAGAREYLHENMIDIKQELSILEKSNTNDKVHNLQKA